MPISVRHVNTSGWLPSNREMTVSKSDAEVLLPEMRALRGAAAHESLVIRVVFSNLIVAAMSIITHNTRE